MIFERLGSDCSVSRLQEGVFKRYICISLAVPQDNAHEILMLNRDSVPIHSWFCHSHLLLERWANKWPVASLDPRSKSPVHIKYQLAAVAIRVVSIAYNRWVTSITKDNDGHDMAIMTGHGPGASQLWDIFIIPWECGKTLTSTEPSNLPGYSFQLGGWWENRTHSCCDCWYRECCTEVPLLSPKVTLLPCRPLAWISQ